MYVKSTLKSGIIVPVRLFFSKKKFHPYALIRTPTIIEIGEARCHFKNKLLIIALYCIIASFHRYLVRFEKYPLRLFRPLRLLNLKDSSTPYAYSNPYNYSGHQSRGPWEPLGCSVIRWEPLGVLLLCLRVYHGNKLNNSNCVV